MTILLFHGREDRRALVLDQEHDELCRLRAAGVPPDRMHVLRAFVERVAGVGVTSFLPFRPITMLPSST